jgi:hypothetical protein
MAFGRKKKADLAVGMLTPPVDSLSNASTNVRAERQVDGNDDVSLGNGKSARDILKRF